MVARAMLAGVMAAFVAAVAARAEIRVVGSDLLPVPFAGRVQALAREAGADAKVAFGGSRPALAAFARGEAEIGLVLAAPGDALPGDPLVSRPIAYLPVTVVVPESSPVRQLTLDQVRGLFAGGAQETVMKWGDLGVAGDWRVRPIAAHALSPAGGLASPLARRLIFNGANLRPTVLAADDVGVLAERIRAGDNTIGLTQICPAPGSGLRAVALAASATMPAYGPTPDNLHDGSYPVRLPLLLVFKRAAAPQLLPFLRALLSAEAAEALEAAGFVPVPAGVRNQLVFGFEELQ